MLKNALHGSLKIFHQKQFIVKNTKSLKKFDNDLTQFKAFEVLFENNLEQIRKETERYAQRRGNSDFSLSLDEVKCAVGILILSGYHRLPSRWNYWEQKPDMLTKIVSDNIRRNKFEKNLQFLHVADSNNLPKDTKVGRVSEYLDKLRKNFKTHCIWDKEFNIDECMVVYFGRPWTFLKQLIRMKPIRFGYKIWCANLPLGYLFDFTIYEGSTGRKTDHTTNFGLGAGVVLDIIDGFPVDSDDNLKPMLLSVDNFFNSFQLIDSCSLRNIPIIDTLRASRIKEVPISSKKDVLKKDREYFEVAHTSNQGTEKAVVVWKDNGVVIMASNCFGSEPIQKAKWWDRKEKKDVSVDMPYVFHKYNTSMGGNDRQDQNVNKYRISICTKQWWWPLFSWAIDVTTQNAWLLFRASHPRWSLLEFRRYVVRCRNKWQSALQPGSIYSKKGHSERVETRWTTTFGWWWSLEKSSKCAT